MYRPELGHTVQATRRKPSRIYANRVIGPITDIWDNACDVLIQQNESITFVRVYFSEWDIDFLHTTRLEEYLGFGTSNQKGMSV